MDKRTIKKAQIRFKNRIMEKLTDYLLTQPDEDEVICRLYFRKGKEEQTKELHYYKPRDEKDDSPIKYIKVYKMDELDKYTTCPKCKADLCLYDANTLEIVPVTYCPFCGADTFQLNFVEYMKNEYYKKDCPESDLINDIISDEDFPRANNYEIILRHLYKKGACDKCIETFIDCWTEYSDYVKGIVEVNG